MRVTVDLAVCQEHGQCAIAAPAVFRLDDDGKLVHDADPEESYRGEVADAADVCPVQAIVISG